jgi:hypothetical protein
MLYTIKNADLLTLEGALFRLHISANKQLPPYTEFLVISVPAGNQKKSATSYLDPIIDYMYRKWKLIMVIKLLKIAEFLN